MRCLRNAASKSAVARRSATSTPTKRCATLRVGVPIVEFGDVAIAEQRAELAEAARSLRDRHREDRLARLAELGALGDETQPVEVHVGAAGDRDEGPVPHAVALAPGLDAGHRQRAGGLEDRARVLEHVLDRGAGRVGVDGDHLVDVPPGEPERLAADLLDRHAVGEQTRRAAALTRRPAASERVIASESTGCTPMILIAGRTRLT